MSPRDIGLYGRSVIGTAEQIANGVRGSGDPASDEAVAWLRWRISPEVWVFDRRSTRYDEAVLALANEALLLHDERGKAR